MSWCEVCLTGAASVCRPRLQTGRLIVHCTGDVSRIPASSVTPVIYGSMTSAQVSPREFWPLHLYAAEPRFVRLNVSVWVAASSRDSGAVVGLYARRGTFPSHTRYDIFHAVDVDKLDSLTSSTINSRTRRAASNVSSLP